MEELFKQNLLKLRNPEAPKTFSAALFPSSPFMAKVSAPSFSHEKNQIIESFKEYVESSLSSGPTGIIQLEGAQIVARPHGDEVRVFSTISELRSSLSQAPETLDILLRNKMSGRVKVVFVTETLRPWSEFSTELRDGLINELITGFTVKTAELFERMISAMKLTPEEVLLYPVDDGHEVLELVAFMRPEVVITLGAKATQTLLKSNDRLTLIHGQFFKRTLNQTMEFQVVPLFHPSIIETNQNMKKTAWADMQKIMKYLKKLP